MTTSLYNANGILLMTYTNARGMSKAEAITAANERIAKLDTVYKVTIRANGTIETIYRNAA